MLLNQNTGCVRIEQMSIGDQNRQRKRLADFRLFVGIDPRYAGYAVVRRRIQIEIGLRPHGSITSIFALRC